MHSYRHVSDHKRALCPTEKGKIVIDGGGKFGCLKLRRCRISVELQRLMCISYFQVCRLMVMDVGAFCSEVWFEFEKMCRNKMNLKWIQFWGCWFERWGIYININDMNRQRIAENYKIYWVVDILNWVLSRVWIIINFHWKYESDIKLTQVYNQIIKFNSNRTYFMLNDRLFQFASNFRVRKQNVKKWSFRIFPKASIRVGLSNSVIFRI